ncbi:Flp pilus assembly protein CpaB [Massilia sp. P8910]|uniref:Flp pilus assembly protein CpaB n=1 Tax=Massilia antarctica TaxID=2765360 RepID=UPI0006BB6329|nr:MULTISPECIES: Flp pilus assembly protein CpaB [Massilia]MCE3606727.1 Flp pilus assembly protein CpaB [Massilia antarctica]MCY0914939.1 Flp pilus assembly protein CpaB [Massilia sp. H27-R4]CUI06904.1 Flp pilus assembly protein RcpC/CpaB [Janthinobacterium sp. CG23_2]CUU30690.1 Flp pilus assembly protein RcpC/CpaB [Janthinobacterium sp. CG23_2]
MKNLKALGLIVFALVIGLAAAVYAAGWVARQGGATTSKVVVAAVDIEPGSKINPEMLSSLDWPAGATPPGAFKDAGELQDRIAKVNILRGEPLLDGKLAPLGTKGGLSAVIAEGKRAMTVRVNDVVGVAGFALPGNYVDVMVNAQQEKSGNEEGKQISKTVLERVLVLAVAQEAGRDDTKPKVVSAVTLELTLEDSEKLDLARSVGTLSLVLRNQVDQKTVSTAGITKDELLGGKKAPAPLPAPAPVRKSRPARSAAAPSPSRAQCVDVIQHGVLAVNCF